MAYQISLDQLLNFLIVRLGILEDMVEDLRMRNNILLRIIASKSDITREDIRKAVEEELKIMEEVGLVDEEVPDIVESLVDDIDKWLKGDVKEMKEKIKEYREKLKEFERSQKGRKIDIAPPDFLHRLDKMRKRT